MSHARTAGLAAAAVLALAAVAPANASDLPRMSLNLAHFAPSTWASSQNDQWFIDQLAERSDGRITGQVFWAGSLGSAMEIIDLTASGAVELGATAPAYFPSQLPISGMTNAIPGLFVDPIIAMDVKSYLMANDPAFQAELRANNIWPVVEHGLMPYRLQCNRPVTTLEDLQGLRVRSFGALNPVMLEALGMVPVNMLLPEVYEGLARGSIDCAFFMEELAVVLRLHEVAKHWSDINFGAFTAYPTYAAYSNFMDGGWPEPVVALMREVAAEAREREMRTLFEAEEAARATALAAGVTFHEFADQDRLWEVAPDMLALWREDALTKGVSAEDADRIVETIRRLVAEYQPS